MDGGTKCTFSNVVHGTHLGATVNALENRDAIQKDLNRLEEWADENLMRRRLNSLTWCALVMEKADYILGCICKTNRSGPMSCFGSPVQDRH